MPTNHPTDEPRPGGPQQPVPQPQQPSTDSQTAQVDRIVEIEEADDSVKPE
jgi:hypothetical protein